VRSIGAQTFGCPKGNGNETAGTMINAKKIKKEQR
jgi:hypothetical protein